MEKKKKKKDVCHLSGLSIQFLDLESTNILAWISSLVTIISFSMIKMMLNLGFLQKLHLGSAV